VETFFGYTYTRVNSATNVPAFSANGGSGQFAVNANKWFSIVADIGAVHNGNIHNLNLDTTLTNFLFGPRITPVRTSRVRPFFDILFGGVHGSTSAAVAGLLNNASQLPAGVPTPTPGQPVTLRAVAAQTAFAMTVGGGLDIKISHHVSFRPVNLDYYLMRLQNLRSLNDNNQHALRYSTGFNFTFGGEAPTPPPPPPPAMRSCWDGSKVPVSAECPKRTMELQISASQSDLCPGGSATVSSSSQIPAGATYQWTVQGEATSKGPTLDFGTTGRQPGSYRIGLTVSAPEYSDATAATTVTLRGYAPPTGTLTANPNDIMAGQKSTLTPNFASGVCGGNVRPATMTASEGTLNGNEFDSSSLQWDPSVTAEQRKTITFTAKAEDDKGSATAQAALVVRKPAVIMASRLPDIVFTNGSARVNNCGKRVLLEQLKALLDADPNGKVVLVGHISEKEASKTTLDGQRAMNAAAVLSAGSGICYNLPASRILVSGAGATDNGVDYQSHFCGTSTQERSGAAVKESDKDAKLRRVEVWFVPSGGTMPASLKDYKEGSTLPLSGLGCPK
jgi:flagellar motor protein MotB